MHKYSEQKTYNATLIVMDDFGVTSNNTQQATLHMIVIPEPTPSLVLPMFMIASLLAVMLYRKRRKKSEKLAKKLQDYWKKSMSSRNRTLVRKTLYGSDILPGAPE